MSSQSEMDQYGLFAVLNPNWLLLLLAYLRQEIRARGESDGASFASVSLLLREISQVWAVNGVHHGFHPYLIELFYNVGLAWDYSELREISPLAAAIQE